MIWQFIYLLFDSNWKIKMHLCMDISFMDIWCAIISLLHYVFVFWFLNVYVSHLRYLKYIANNCMLHNVQIHLKLYYVFCGIAFLLYYYIWEFGQRLSFCRDSDNTYVQNRDIRCLKVMLYKRRLQDVLCLDFGHTCYLRILKNVILAVGKRHLIIYLPYLWF